MKIILAIRIWFVFLVWDIIGTMWNIARMGDYCIELKRDEIYSHMIHGIGRGRFVQRPSVCEILDIL